MKELALKWRGIKLRGGGGGAGGGGDHINDHYFDLHFNILSK